MERTRLCAIDDIAEGEAKGFVARVGGKQRNILVVRKDGAYYGYLNRCPHAQNLLDQIPGIFFNRDNTKLRCGLHGAVFRIEDGLCLGGPCEGESLTSLSVETEGGNVVLVA